MPRQWIVVASIAVNSFVSAGFCAVAIGLFISPWMSEFGWPNALTSGIATAFNLTQYLAAPLVGIALDKLGARPVMSFGALATAAGFFLASRCHNWYALLAAFVLAGLGFCASFYLPSAVVIANWMGAQRNLGMGIVMGAMSAGAALFSLLIGYWVEAYGWRPTAGIISVFVLLMFPMILLTLQTRTAAEVQPVAAEPVLETLAKSPSALWLSPAFLFAVSSSVLFSMGMGGIYFHVDSILLNAGYSAHWAGIVFGSTWIFSGLGSLGLGILADRSGAKAILAAALLSCAVGPLLLMGAGVATTGILCVALFVVLWGVPANGVAQFIPIVFVERFGGENLGTLIGMQQAIAGVAGAVTPVVTGLLYDEFKDYRVALYLSAVEILIAVILILLISAPQTRRMEA